MPLYYEQSSKYMNTNYFTQFCLTENITLPNEMPDIDQIISCVAEPKILSVKTISTFQGHSYEGQYLSGKKVVIEFKLKQKTLYVAKYSSKSVHIYEHELYQSSSIVVPCKIEGTDPEYLLEQQYLKPSIILNEMECNCRSERSIFKRVSIILHLIQVPTYELCYAIQTDHNSSDIFIVNTLGNNSKILNPTPEKKHKKPIWAPSGDQIAYLTNMDNHWALSIYNLKTESTRFFNPPSPKSSITGYDWSTDGAHICCTVYDNKSKDLFLFDINTFSSTQLTYGKEIYLSSHPKYSPDGTKLGFIRTFSNRNDLWLMNIDGSNCKKTTQDGGIIDFAWSPDGTYLAVLSNLSWPKSRITFINIEKEESISLPIGLNIINIKKLTFSFDGTYLSFISTFMDIDNIYVYDIKQCRTQNITCYKDHAAISDYTWNTNESQIYYSVNDLFYYNIYKIDLATLTKSQLTFNTATYMELDYRPRIS